MSHFDVIICLTLTQVLLNSAILEAMPQLDLTLAPKMMCAVPPFSLCLPRLKPTLCLRILRMKFVLYGAILLYKKQSIMPVNSIEQFSCLLLQYHQMHVLTHLHAYIHFFQVH